MNRKLYHNLLKELFFKAKDTKWIVLMTAVVMVMVSLIYAVGDQIVYSFAGVVNRCMPFDCMIAGVTEEELAVLGAKDAYGDTARFLCLSTPMITDAYPQDSSFYFNISCMEGDWQELAGVALVEGQAPAEEWEIALDSRAKEYFPVKYQVGDEIGLSIYSYAEERFVNETFHITGFLEDVGGTGNALNAVAALHTGEILCGEVYGECPYRVLLKARDDRESSVNALLSKAIELGAADRLQLNYAKFEAIEEKDNGASFSSAFRGLAVLIGLLSFAMLYNLINISVNEKTRRLGLLKCLGLDGRQMIEVLLLCTLLYLTFGTLLALAGYFVLEKLLGEMLLHQFVDSFDTGIDMTFRMDFSAFAVSALLVGAVFLAVYGWMAVKVCRISPLGAVHYRDAVRRKTSNQKKEQRQDLITFLGRRNLGRNRTRSIYTAFTMGLTGMLLLVVINVFCNVEITDNPLLLNSRLFDLEFFGDEENSFVDAECVGRILDMSGIDNLAWGRIAPFEFFLTKERTDLLEIRIYSDELFAALCEENGVKTGDRLTQPSFFLLRADEGSYPENMTLYDREGIPREIRLDGVLQYDYCAGYSIDGGALILNEMAGRELLGDYDCNLIFVKTGEPEEVRRALQELLEEKGYALYCNDLRQISKGAEAQLRSIVLIAAYVLVCIGFMTLVNLVCNIEINIRLRDREYGIISALGMEERRIVRLMIYELMQLAQNAVFAAMIFGFLISMHFVLNMNDNASLLKLLATTLLGAAAFYGAIYILLYFLSRGKYRRNAAPMLREE